MSEIRDIGEIGNSRLLRLQFPFPRSQFRATPMGHGGFANGGSSLLFLGHQQLTLAEKVLDLSGG
jgi:hypothetical protein